MLVSIYMFNSNWKIILHKVICLLYSFIKDMIFFEMYNYVMLLNLSNHPKMWLYTF